MAAPKIVALVSTYKEEDILASCVRSAKHCDSVVIFDGPTNAEERVNWRTVPPPFPLFGNSVYIQGGWTSDADKRTTMLGFAKSFGDKQHDWALWLDGDEVLIWGKYLHDHCKRADQETATGGTTLRIVEYDGSVAECYGKLIKLDSIKRYVMSSYEVELTNGMTVALPNVPICYAGGLPYGKITGINDPLLGRNRPPLAGEPHLLHRHGLRDPNRGVERLHEAEADSFSVLVKDAGLEGVDKQTVEKGN